MVIIKINKEIINSHLYPGTEFLREKNIGDFLVPMKFIDIEKREDLEKKMIPGRIYSLIEKIENEGISSLNGTNYKDYIDCHNGFHKFLLMYTLLGFEGNVPVRGIDKIDNLKERRIFDIQKDKIYFNQILKNNIEVFEYIKENTIKNSFYKPYFGNVKRLEKQLFK